MSECQHQELLLDYVYEELSPAQAAALTEHLPGCSACARELAGLRGVRGAMASLPAAELPEDAVARMTAEVMLDSIDMVTGSKTDFADLPAGTRAISLPDNSYNQSTYFLSVFGRPDSSSACECERTQEASLAQSLHLLNAADLKLVRGEDSFVRAQWAGLPFLWHAYPQHDGAHQAKLDAFLALHLDGASGAWVEHCRAAWLQWNGGAGTLHLPLLKPWRAHCRTWCDKLAAHQDLGTQLLSFAREKS